MNVAAVISADLQTAPIGTASRLAHAIHGTPVLTRTLQRLARCTQLSTIVVCAPANQVEKVRALASGLDVIVKAFDGPQRPAMLTLRVARKWSLHSWRGGLGNSTYFDEYVHPGLYAAVAEQLGADAVAGVPAEAPLIDPALIDDMIAHLAEGLEDNRMVFAQAPPGVVATILRRDLLVEAAEAGTPVGWINAYRPDKPIQDYIRTASCYRVPMAVQHAAGRLTSDTHRGLEWLETLIGEGADEWPAERICSRLSALRSADSATLPLEVQVELTVEDHHASTRLRPRGQQVGSRPPMTAAVFERIVETMARYDDALLTFGGFGEPLLHPEFTTFVRRAREAGIFGIALRTNGLALDERIASALIDAHVDIVQVLVDATTAQRYEDLHGCAGLDQVRANVEGLVELRRKAGQPAPNVIGSLVKAVDTLDDMEVFFDDWVRSQGWAVLEGYSHHAELLPDRAVMSMAPPRRRPCRQLLTRCTILSDGTVVGCDQDFKGLFAAGTVGDHELGEIWTGDSMQRLRAAHADEDYALHPMCAKCDEWHRP